MKLFLRYAIVSVFGCLLLTSAVLPAAAAEKMPAPSIMVIDIQKIINESRATKTIMSQRDKFSQTYQQEFAAEEGKLAAERKALDDQRTVLSPEAFADKQKAFNTKAADFGRRVQIRGANLNESVNNAMGQVLTHLNKIIREMAGEFGANLVMNRNQVEYFDPGMDKTAIAAERLNTTMKEVTFLDPVKMGEAQAKARAEAAKSKDKEKEKKK